MFENINEVWRDVAEYNGKYQVSNLGRVRSVCDTKQSRVIILKPMKQKNGYLYVSLWRNNKKKNVLIHRLVAQSFVDNPNNHKEVNHKDENKENNVVENLEWCEHKYNMNYGSVGNKISVAKMGKAPWNKGKKFPNISLRQKECVVNV